MRRWVKWTLGGVALAIVLFSVLAGVGGYYFLRHLETGTTTEAATLKQFESIKARYPERPPLVEIINPQAGDIRINKTRHPEGKEATTLHFITWEAESGRKLESDLPLWLMRFSSYNVLSKLGITPAKYRLVVADIERYGPGIVAEFRRPGESYGLIWAE
ncbi:MAG TPA: hypothetical protein VN700_17875 [Vicinamibacterales bacterium]|nr:hypothetical protein [Vicinamibacterales bacterium]